MAAQYHKKNLTKIFGLLACLLTYNSTQLMIQIYVDSSRTYAYGRLLENPKTWNSREFLPENDFKTYSIASFMVF